MVDARNETDAEQLAHEPTQIRLLDQAQVLEITWADGHVAALPFAYARGFCPCAVCQGHGGDLAFVPTEGPLQLEDVLEVGHYALNLVWADGHRTGIYAMPYLRSLCPCSACVALYGSRHAWHRLDASWAARFQPGVDAP